MKPFLITSFIIISFLSFTSTSCEKPFGETEKETVYLPDSLKAYCDFKEGSYWIYQDSVSKELDSVFLYKRNHDISINRYINKNVEDINSFYNYEGDTVRMGLWFNLDDNFLFTSSNKELWGGFNFPIFIIKKSAVYDSDSLHPALRKEYFSILETSERSYNSLVKFTYVDGAYGEGLDESRHRFRSCYFVKGIGMVKQEYRDGRVFELLRYNVIQ